MGDFRNDDILFVGIKNQKLGRNYQYDEELVVPIIENTPFEEDLTDRLEEAIKDYPHTCAVLVRRHGVSFIFIYFFHSLISSRIN